MSDIINGMVDDGNWGKIPGHIWLGVTAENQEQADKRIPILLQTPASVRFVSVEPMIGPVSLRWLSAWDGMAIKPHPGSVTNELDGLKCLDWVICGGESGPGARPMHPDWARSLRDQCQAAGVPFFFKQWGEWTSEFPQWLSLASRAMAYQHGETFYRVGKKAAGRLLDGKEHSEYPKV
jgi:protein gp37